MSVLLYAKDIFFQLRINKQTAMNALLRTLPAALAVGGDLEWASFGLHSIPMLHEVMHSKP